MSYNLREQLKEMLLKKLKIILISLCAFNRIFCVTIGSDTAVNRFLQQQILNKGDRVAGFAALEAGFRFSSNLVSATFDSNFPVIGNVALEGGTLSLSKDLVFNDISNFNSFGNIVGNNHKIELAQSMKRIPEDNLSTICGPESCRISAITSSSQAAAVYSCDWSYDDKFIATGLLTNGFRIYQFNGSSAPTLKYSNTINSKTVNDLCWHPSKNLLAVGTINNTTTSVTELQIYSVNQATGVATLTSGVETACDIYAVDWHPLGDFIAVGKNVSTQEIAIYSVDANGVINSTPASFYDAPYAVQIGAMRWNSDGTYLAVGLNASATNQLLIFKFNKDTGVLTLDSSFSTGYSVYSVSWSKLSPNYLAVGLSATSGEMLKIYEFDPAASKLNQRAAKSDLSTYVFNLGWSPKNNCLAVGINYSAGYEFRSYFFDSTNYNFNQTAGFELGSYAVRCVRWSRSGDYVACGCDNRYLYIYGATSCDRKTLDGVEFDSLNLFLNGDLSLQSSKITFNGNCLIDGRGHSLDLFKESAIVIGSNSSLLLKNLSVSGLVASNIYCTDDTSTLFLDNCEWQVGSDYNFNSGHFELLGDFNIIGDGYNFNYGSRQESRVGSNSSLILDRNLGFNCDPSLIVLQDRTSKILVSSSNDISSLFSLVNANTANIAGNTSSIAANTSSINAHSTSIAAHTASINANNSAISNLATSTGNLLTLVNASNANISNLITSTGNLLALVSANTASVIANSLIIADNALAIAVNSGAIDALKTSTGNLLTLINTSNTNIENLKTSTGELELYIDNVMEFGIEDIRKDLDEIGTITAAMKESINDLYLRAGACVHNIYQNTNFTRDMLPSPGKVAVFRFNECCLSVDKPKLIFDPNIYGGGNEIELADNSRIIFEGDGIVELANGVKFKLNGVAQEQNNNLEFSSSSKIIIRDGAELSVAENSVAKCIGTGQFLVVSHGSFVLNNGNSQFIFGESVNDTIKLLVQDCGLVSIDDQNSLLTFQYGKFAVDFRRSSILNIYKGIVEFNTNKSAIAPGKLILLRFISDSSLMVDKQMIGQNLYCGMLRLGPNIDDEMLKFDNKTGLVYGDGHLQFVPSDNSSAIDLTMQRNCFKDINTMSKIFTKLGISSVSTSIGASSSSNTSGGSNSSSTSNVSIGVTSSGQVASFNPDGSVTKLQDGDHDISYINSGNIVLVGIDKDGKVFKIDKDGNRINIGTN